MTLGIAGELTPRQTEYTGHILSSSQTLLAIIDDILDLATIDAGVMELSPSELDVGETLKAAAGLVQDRVRKRGLVLEIEIADGVGRLVADERRVKQVLYNLLSNAIGFSPNGGKIAMGARHDGDDVVLWVTDHGAGIDPEHQSSVFDRFETRSGGSQHRGAGLGLSIVKSLTELHGGSISLSSMPNEGTTVECRFPAGGPAVDRPAEASGEDYADAARRA
jgi:signal transduction histidine kinase